MKFVMTDTMCVGTHNFWQSRQLTVSVVRGGDLDVRERIKSESPLNNRPDGGNR